MQRPVLFIVTCFIEMFNCQNGTAYAKKQKRCLPRHAVRLAPFLFFDCLIVEIDEFDAVEIAGDDFAGGQIL